MAKRRSDEENRTVPGEKNQEIVGKIIIDNSSRKKPPALNLLKVLSAISARGMTDTEVQRRARWFPNRIHDWKKKGGELTAQQAREASMVLDVAYSYITNDEIPINHDDPPKRNLFEDENFAQKAANFGLTPREALEGLRLVGVCKDLEIEISEAIRALSSTFAERIVMAEDRDPPSKEKKKQG